MRTVVSARIWTAVLRGARRRCPRCGSGPIFLRWIEVRERCPACGLRYLENQGDLWGYLLFIDRALFLFPIVVVMYLRLLDPHAIWFWIFIVGMMYFLVASMPVRNGIGVALDWLVRTRGKDPVRSASEA